MKTVNVKIVGRATSVETTLDVLFMLIFNFVEVVLWNILPLEIVGLN